MSDERVLSDRELAFARHFMTSHNATRAATEAGYAKASAHVAGHRLLQRPHVRDEIARLEGKALGNAAQVAGLLRNAKEAATAFVGGGAGAATARDRDEDADTVAAATRTFILAALIENLEIALGRRKRRVTRLRKSGGGGRANWVEEAYDVEIYDPNPAAANQAAMILLRELPNAARPTTVTGDVTPALLEALQTFRESRPTDPAK